MFELSRSRLLHLVIGGFVALVLTAGSCESEPSATEGDAAPAASSSTNTDTNDASTNTNSNDAEQSSPPAGSQDFQTIWGIPPFGVSRVDPVFGQYAVIDDDFQFSETVFFEIEGTTVEEVIAYYTDLLRSMGYTVPEPFLAGGSQVLSPDDGDPNTSAVLQAGPTIPGGDVIGVNQGRTRINTVPGSDQQDPAVESSDATADDAVLEGDE